MAKKMMLRDVPPGLLFQWGEVLAFKTEYGDNDGNLFCYLVGSGERLSRGNKTPQEMQETMVTPIDIEKIQEGMTILRDTLAFSTRDWSEAADLAAIWGVVFGWSKEAMVDMQSKHGWNSKLAKDIKKSNKHIKRLK